MRKSLIGVAALGMIGAVWSGATLAATTWLLGSGGICTGEGASRTCAGATPVATPPNVVATAWSFGGTGATDTLGIASIGAYSGGVGVTASSEGGSGSPNHSVDNFVKIDAVLLSFWDKVTLTQVTSGWVGPRSGESPSQTPDSDFSLLAYTFGNDPSVAMSTGTKTASGLLNTTTGGWKLVGHYDGTENPGGGPTTVTNSESSKYWLISAYNLNFGGFANGADTGYGQYDFLKLYSVTFTQNGRVPEPGTLLLLGAAALGFWRVRRAG